MKNNPDLSIIIVNHRSNEILNDCIKSIDDSDVELSIEVIIVDNPESNLIIDFDYNSIINIRKLSTMKRIGFGAACNNGVASAAGDYIMFMNPDVVLAPDALKTMFSFLSSNDGENIVAGRLIGLDGHFQASCRRFPTFGNMFFSRGSLIHKIAGRETKSYTLPDYPEITKVDSTAAAMMMMNKKAFEHLGGFDESFYLYLEDTDLCYRHTQEGGQIYFIPEAGAAHHWGYSTRRYRFRRIIWHHRSVWTFFQKHHWGIENFAILLPLLLINCFLSLILEMFTLGK